MPPTLCISPQLTAPAAVLCNSQQPGTATHCNSLLLAMQLCPGRRNLQGNNLLDRKLELGLRLTLKYNLFEVGTQV